MCIDNIDRLAEVHWIILEHLKTLTPVKLLRINQIYYNELAPFVYRSICLTEKNVHRIFPGLMSDNNMTVNRDFKDREEGNLKLAALRSVTSLKIDDWIAAGALARICLAFAACRSRDERDGHEAEKLFSNVQHVHFGASLVLQRSTGLCALDRSSRANRAREDEALHIKYRSDSSNWHRIRLDLRYHLVGLTKDRKITVSLDLPEHWPEGPDRIQDLIINALVNSIAPHAIHRTININVPLGINLDHENSTCHTARKTQINIPYIPLMRRRLRNHIDECSFRIVYSDYHPSSADNLVIREAIARSIWTHYVSSLVTDHTVTAFAQYIVAEQHREGVLAALGDLESSMAHIPETQREPDDIPSLSTLILAKKETESYSFAEK